MMSVKFVIYSANKKKKPRLDPALSVNLINLLKDTKFTKRVALVFATVLWIFGGNFMPFLDSF